MAPLPLRTRYPRLATPQEREQPELRHRNPLVFYHRMAELIPEGISGAFMIRHRLVEVQEEINQRRYVMELQLARGVPKPPEKVCRLVHRGMLADEVIMTDDFMERDTNLAFLMNARGDVLIAGLGIGMIVAPLLHNPRVRSITVVEKSDDVIRLVARHLKRVDTEKKLKVVQGDIFEYETDFRFETIYFDMWPGMFSENVAEMRALKKKFSKNLMPGGWIDSWGRRACELYLRKGIGSRAGPEIKTHIAQNLPYPPAK